MHGKSFTSSMRLAIVGRQISVTLVVAVRGFSHSREGRVRQRHQTLTGRRASPQSGLLTMIGNRVKTALFLFSWVKEKCNS